MIPKTIRIKNGALLRTYRGKPCEICGSTETTVGHHIKTVGSGGDDIKENIVALCFIHHREIHDTGVDTFNRKYSRE